MQVIDYIIVFFYLLLMVLTGVYFRRQASHGIESYFLGNRRLSWWVLGASGMASNLDVSGTMINVTMIYVFGAMGLFIEIRGGIVLIMAFLMVFMGKWNRRANVMTMAEWMELRFGKGGQGRAARLITAIATLITTIWIITYFAVGAGKFIAEFLKIPSYGGIPSQFWASTIMILLAMIYTVTSGLYGVVWTDVYQGSFIFLTILIISSVCMTRFEIPATFDLAIPMKDGAFTTISATREQWTSLIPSWHLDLPADSSYAFFNLFGLAIIFYLIKAIIEGSAGTGGYMIQRFFASRSDRDAGLLSLFWIVLLAFRWPFIAALAIMGISLSAEQGQLINDPERVLPIVIQQLVPIGIKGLLVAGLMAAAMSTFDSLVNAGASYWVRDIYQAFLRPHADEKKLVFQSRLATIVLVAAGLFLTFNVQNLNEIWGWLTMGIGFGLTIPLLIRWYWWRLNGYGFAWGVAAGMSTALIQRWLFPDLAEYFVFLIIVIISLFITIFATWLSKPTEEDVLINFFKKTRPFGIWKPIRQRVNPQNRESEKLENKRDMISTILAVPWQFALFMLLLMIVMKQWLSVFFLTICVMFLSIGLYYFWFRHLSTIDRPVINEPTDSSYTGSDK